MFLVIKVLRLSHESAEIKGRIVLHMSTIFCVE